MTLLTALMILVSSSAPGPWQWPLEPTPQVVRDFSPPAAPWGPGHRGVDLAARPGQPVYAAGPGRVSYAGRLAGRGVVAITHGDLRTTYLPVRAGLRAGEDIPPGARIGTVEGGASHCAGPCLHWGLLRGAVYLDPLTLVRTPVRLLPHWKSPPAAPAGESEQPHQMELRDAATAGGGVLTGMVLAFAFLFAWRQGQSRTRARRPPPGVIDLARERDMRRTP